MLFMGEGFVEFHLYIYLYEQPLRKVVFSGGKFTISNVRKKKKNINIYCLSFLMFGCSFSRLFSFVVAISDCLVCSFMLAHCVTIYFISLSLSLSVRILCPCSIVNSSIFFSWCRRCVVVTC